MPPEVQQEAEREVERLTKLPQAAPEYSVIRTYLDWLTSLPWSVETPDRVDLAEARRILDADHEDLEKVKERILEFLAVRASGRSPSGPFCASSGPRAWGRRPWARASPGPS